MGHKNVKYAAGEGKCSIFWNIFHGKCFHFSHDLPIIRDGRGSGLLRGIYKGGLH